jgi:hypothetical protein
MRGITALLAAAWLIIPAVVAQTTGSAHDSAPLELTISTDHKVYTKVDDIAIHVRLRNISNRDVFVGRDIWTCSSSGCVSVRVRSLNGRPLNTWMIVGDGFPPDASLIQLPKEVLEWGLLLAPGFSYGYDAKGAGRVEPSEMLPGSYEFSAEYDSRGIEADHYMNPFLAHPDVMATLQEQNWKGQIVSNHLIIRIAAPRVSTRKDPQRR